MRTLVCSVMPGIADYDIRAGTRYLITAQLVAADSRDDRRREFPRWQRTWPAWGRQAEDR